MSSRSAARFLAVQTLYQLDLVPGEAPDAFAQVAAMHEAPEDVTTFGLELVVGTLDRLDEIDPLIAEHLSDAWTLARVGRVEKAIMRLASFELLRGHEVPTAVVLNEALELTRDFLDDGAVKFVNGVLDRVARRARGEPTRSDDADDADDATSDGPAEPAADADPLTSAATGDGQ